MTTMLGIDLAKFQNPFSLPYTAWILDGLEVVIIQITHGTKPEPVAHEHLSTATAYGVKHIGAYHWLTIESGKQQAIEFKKELDPRYQFVAIDVEQVGVTAQHLLDFLSELVPGFKLTILLYGNNLLAEIVAAHPELKQYGVWYAGYPTFPLPCSLPPFDKPHNVPASIAGQVRGWQYAGDNGVWLPYNGAIDRSVWYQVPGAYMPMQVVVPRGSLAGLYADQPGKVVDECAKAAARGIPYSSVGILDDGGAPIDIAKVSPKTHVFLRYYNPQDDSLQNLFYWSPQQEDDWVMRSMNYIEGRTSDETARATYRFIVHNEADPPEVGAWYKYGKILIKLIDECERRNARRIQNGQPIIKLGLVALPQGVPEWSEMLELDDSGLFQRMQQVDAVFVAHEGVFRDQHISDGYGSGIPGAPTIAGAGSACFRFVYLFEGILRPRGHLVKLWIGEWYPGGQVTDPPESRVQDYEWYDSRLSAYEYVEGFVGFTCWPNPDWVSSDLTPTCTSEVFYQSREKVKDRINGGLMPYTVSDEDMAALVAHNTANLANEQKDAAILAKYQTWWSKLPSGVFATPVAYPAQPADKPYGIYGPNGEDYHIQRTNGGTILERNNNLLRVTSTPVQGTPTPWWIKAEQLAVHP